MQEEKTLKPSLWNQAMKVVKGGDSTQELVEQFTQEMTLVAEGLCEDQARLRKAVDGLIRQAEGSQEKAVQDYEALEKQLSSHEKETKQRLEELSRRVEQLEKGREKEKKLRLSQGDLITRVTVLAGMICGTMLLVTLIRALM